MSDLGRRFHQNTLERAPHRVEGNEAHKAEPHPHQKPTEAALQHGEVKHERRYTIGDRVHNAEAQADSQLVERCRQNVRKTKFQVDSVAPECERSAQGSKEGPKKRQKDRTVEQLRPFWLPPAEAAF